MVPLLRASVLVVLVLAELNVAVTPVGSPVTVRATLLLKPLILLTLTVLLALAPLATRARLPAEDERLKLGTGIVSATVVVRVAVPEVPVTVTV